MDVCEFTPAELIAIKANVELQALIHVHILLITLSVFFIFKGFDERYHV